MKKTITLLALAALCVGLSFGQTTLTSTTLSAAQGINDKTVSLTSATGVTVPGAANQINTVIYLDHELERITGLVTGQTTVFTVQRGVSNTRQYGHASGVVVWLGSPTNNFLGNSPINAEVAGTCVSTAELTLPKIYTSSGHMYDCLGVAGAQQWVLTSASEFPVFGSTVASPAGLLTPTGSAFKVSGVNAITGLNLPGGWAAGQCLQLIPTGIWSVTTATNVSLATTAVVGKTLFECWDGSKWNPSY